MARLLFEIQAVRRRSGALADGVPFAVYSDEAGTALADISATAGGSAIAGSTVTTGDVAGLGPASAEFYGPPSGVDTLYIRSSDTSLGVQKIEANDLAVIDAGAARLAADNLFTADQVFGSGRPWLDVRAFGALGDNAADDTAAFQAAADASNTVDPTGRISPIYVPRGFYRIHEVDLPSGAMLFCESTTAGALLYNGAGGAGSYMLKFTNCSSGGMADLRLHGADASLPAAAESLVVLNGVIDNQFIYHNNQHQWCTGDAISMDPSTFVNFHLERGRFDSIGGYAIGLVGNVGAENRPLNLRNFTYDNSLSPGDIGTILGYDGTHWGKGLVHLDNGNGIFVVVTKSRIEINRRYVDDEDAALVYDENNTGTTTVVLDDVYIPGGPGAVRIPVVSTETLARARVVTRACSLAMRGWVYDRTAGKMYGRESLAHHVGGAGGNRQRTLGIAIGQDPVQIDAASITNLPGMFQRFQSGDWQLYPHEDISPGSRGFARVMVQPTAGWAVPAGASEQVTTAGAISASGTALTGIPSSYTKELRDANISIAGAGTAGAAHLCRVTAYDPDTGTATITPAAVTTVSGVIVTWQPPVWRDLGGNSATAVPSTGTWNRGERVWNSTPAIVSDVVADYVVLGWDCVASGTPGTWVELRCLVEALTPGPSAPAQIDVFTASGTYTKPGGATSIAVVAIGGGAGGGSGRRGAAGTVRTGGAGGGGGAVTRRTISASVIGATAAVVVGTGGAGGAAVTTDDTSGNTGSVGGTSTFGSVLIRASGTIAGGGGSTTAAVGGVAAPGMFLGGVGASSSGTGGVGTSATTTGEGAGGGGSAGGITSGDAVSDGGTGGHFPLSVAGSSGGGAAGTAGGAGGNGSAATVGAGAAGTGGGGGASSIVGAAGAGGAGGVYGGGGGGGGASLNANASGAGGAGADGVVVVTTYF